MPRRPKALPQFDAQAFDRLSLPDKIEYLREFIATLNAGNAPRRHTAPTEDGGKKKSG